MACMLLTEQEQMKGSTVEAMADAVEGAAKVCYGVSRAYQVLLIFFFRFGVFYF